MNISGSEVDNKSISKNRTILIVGTVVVLLAFIGAVIMLFQTSSRIKNLENRTHELETNVGAIRMKTLWYDYQGTVDTAGDVINLGDSIKNYDCLLVYYIDGWGILERRVVDGITYYNSAVSQAGTNQSDENLNVWKQYVLLKEVNDTTLKLETSGMYAESNISSALDAKTNDGNVGNVTVSTTTTNYATRPIWAIYGLKFN